MNIFRFFRSVYSDNRLRVDSRKRPIVDLARYAANRVLSVRERQLTAQHRIPGAPIIFIVGVPRSGTTLLYQLMAKHLDVLYVTNEVARYWLAPLWAFRRNETETPIDLRSHLGLGEGPAAPHEFGWFWEYHAPLEGLHHRVGAELSVFDWDSIRAELEGIAGWSGRPLVLKSLLAVDYHISQFARELRGASFIRIERDPRFTAQSLLEARRNRYGDEWTWLSIRPRDVDAWRDRAPVEQVAHQIGDVSRHIEAGLAALPSERWLSLRYENLLADPLKEIQKVAGFAQVSMRNTTDLAKTKLHDGNVVRTIPKEFALIEAALRGEGLLR
ncbi:MAG: sulfotransferase [Polyangiales bacterium]